jgi:hypothetical protein
MKGQVFGFMHEMAAPIRRGLKRLTNRKASEFRQALEVGGTMHLIAGLRSKHTDKLGTARAIGIYQWNTRQLRTATDFGESPLPRQGPYNIRGWDWKNFARLDGFDSVEKMRNWFLKRYGDSQDMLCFYWGDTFIPEGDA